MNKETLDKFKTYVMKFMYRSRNKIIFVKLVGIPTTYKIRTVRTYIRILVITKVVFPHDYVNYIYPRNCLNYKWCMILANYRACISVYISVRIYMHIYSNLKPVK